MPQHLPPQTGTHQEAALGTTDTVARSGLPATPPIDPVSPSMRCHESRMPVERHDHRPAPTLPRELPPLFLCRPPPPYIPLPPRLSAHLQLTLAFPSPVQSSPALPCCPALPLPFRPPSPPPLTDRPEKSHHLVSPFRASKNPAHCHPSIHFGCRLFFPFSFLPDCSARVFSLLPSLLFDSGRPTPPSAGVRNIQSHPIPSGSNTRTLAPLVPRISEPNPLSAATHVTTTIPQQSLTSSWLLSPACKPPANTSSTFSEGVASHHLAQTGPQRQHVGCPRDGP